MSEYCQYEPEIDAIDFRICQPNDITLNLELINEAFKYLSDKNSQHYLNDHNVLQYSNVQGIPKIRKLFCEWLDKKNNELIEGGISNLIDNGFCSLGFELENDYKIDSENLFFTNGVSGAIQLIVTSLCLPDDIILVENPTYHIMIDILQELELKIYPINLDENGFNLEDLSNKLEFLHQSQNRIILYCTPFHNNPSGISLSHVNKLALADIANVYNNFYILSDEAYHFLSWEKIR